MKIIITIIILALLFCLFMYIGKLYNRFVAMRTCAEEAYSTMDIYLKKRFDLIPNLVATVKGYTKHEAETLERVIAARNTAYASGDSGKIAKAEGELSSSLKSLFALTESYPDLKANTNFIALQSSLEKIETDISQARKYYNGRVRNYNMTIQLFPANLIANILGFKKMSFFEIDEQSRENVKVEF